MKRFVSVCVICITVFLFPRILCALSSIERITQQGSLESALSDSPTKLSILQDAGLKQEKYVGGTLEIVTFESPISFESSEKILRTGVLIRRPNAKGTIFICHGFMCDKIDASFLRMMFPQFNIFMFDFRAHGERSTDIQTCTFGKDESLDVAAAVNYIKSRQDIFGPRIVYGFSMGAVASIVAQASDPTLFDGMVLDCPYDHSINVLRRGIDNLKIPLFGYNFSLPGRDFLEQYAFEPWMQAMLKTLLKTVAKMDATAINTKIYPLSPADFAKKISVPCFFIHCVQDEKVHTQAAHTLYENVKGYKRLWLTAGRHHFDSFFFNPEKYFYKIGRFVDDVVNLSTLSKRKERIIKDLVE